MGAFMKKSILFVSQRFPYPLTDGGNIRTFKILQALSARYDVSLVASRCGDASVEDSLRSVRDICVDAVCVPDVKSRRPAHMARVAARSLSRGIPLAVAFNHNPHIEREYRTRVDSGKFRWIHLNHLDTAQYLDGGTGGARVALDSHNLLYKFYAKISAHGGNPLVKLASRVEAMRMKAYEFAVFRKVDRLLVCSGVEREALRGHGIGESVLVVPNGVDCGYFHPPADGYADNPPTVVFTGVMGYPPNADAAAHFIRDVMPLLRPMVPGVRFLAVGKDPPESLIQLGREHADVTVTGSVPDVRAHVWGSSVFAVPIRMGAGTRLKILEAFAMGIPAVSTSLGAEGIEYRDGSDILIADDPAAMARAIRSLFGDPALRAKLSASALRLAHGTYDWNTVGERLLEAYDSPSAAPSGAGTGEAV